MSWNAPKNWDEVTRSIRAGWNFGSASLRVTGTRSPGYVCGNQSTRGYIWGHLDDLARDVIASSDALNKRYMDTNRYQAERPEDFVYVVLRDGNVLAALRRNGEIEYSPQTETAALRYRRALDKVLPAMAELARTWKA